VTLADDTPWDVDPGIVDPPRFLRCLPELFPDATLFFAEGAHVPSTVGRVLKAHTVRSPYLPGRESLGASRYSCACSPPFFEALAAACDQVEDRPFDHLHLYRAETQLLSWHDAFENAFLLDGGLPESTVMAVAACVQGQYGRATFPPPAAG
jgi:hypothetical protein